MAGWRRDRAVRARYDEVVDIYKWLGDFTDTLDPDRDEDLLTDLFYVDSMVAGWISRGQFEKPGVREFVVKAIAQADSNRAAHSTPPPDELWPRQGCANLRGPNSLPCRDGWVWSRVGRVAMDASPLPRPRQQRCVAEHYPAPR